MNVQVGQRHQTHTGTVKQPLQRPWWGYQYGWPWYGQQQCYFDAWQGVWVCPSSPWIYQPLIQTWYYQPWGGWGGWGGWGSGRGGHSGHR